MRMQELERLQAVLLVLAGSQGASESRESLRFKGVSVASTRRARMDLATTRLPDRCLPSGNDTALPLFVRQRQTCGGCYGNALREKAEHLPVAEIAGIEPAPLCELKHKGKWSHSSPVTDRCTTLFCRDCTYSLGSARGTDRRHPVCVCYRPFGRPQAQT